MSDKNFKVKNGIDANGTITVSSFSDATSNLTINENVSTRRNLVLNPVFAVNDTTGWGSYFQATNTIITDATAPYGTKVLQIQIPKDANPHGAIWFADESQQANIAYSVSAYVKGPAGVQGEFSGRPTLPDLSYLSEGSAALTFTFTGSWQRIYFTYTPSVAYRTGFQLTISPTQYSTTMNFYMHGIVVEYGSTTNLPYFDGSQNAYADKYRATTAWSGTANLSKSTITYISQTANALEVKGNSSTIAKIDPYGTLTISASATPTSINGQYGNLTVRSTTLADSLNAAAYINTGYAPGVGLILRGYGSQTADLQQWQYSDGNTYARISPYGQLAIGDVNPPIYSNARISLNTVATSAVGLVIRGVSSQTANLQEWQDSGGTALGFFNAYGTFTANNRIYGGWAAFGSGYGTAASASNVVLIAKGSASQTANLQEWQNSAGTVLASISPTGKLTSAVDASINGMTLGWGGGQDYHNLAFGYTALNNNTTGQLNMAMGYRALQSNTTGWNNMSLGADSLAANTTGQLNTAVGAQALYSNTSGGENVAIGNWALLGGNGGWNTAIGSSSMNQNSGSAFNTAVGRASLYSISTGAHNTAIGQQASGAITTGNSNSILGSEALISLTTGNSNIAIGRDAGHSVVTGSANIFLGYQAGYSETGSNKLYIANTNTTTPLIGGDFSAKTLTVAGNATITSQATGTVGLIVQGAASQTAHLQQWKDSSGNIVFYVRNDGFQEATNTARFPNVQTNNIYDIDSTAPYISFASNKLTINSRDASYVGLVVKGSASQTADLQQWQNSSGTALAKVDATGNATFNTVYVGLGGGSIATNIALGGSALSSNTTGYVNTAIGLGALQSNTTGWGNTGIGTYALQYYSGNVNTGIGYSALRNATAEGLVAIGFGALASNTSGGSNTAVGYYALGTNITGAANTAFGSQSSRLSTGDRNTSLGFYSAYNLTTGTDNVFIGSQAGQSFTTGSANIAIGSFNSWYQTSTGSNNTFIGHDGGGKPVTGSNNTTLGYQASISSSSVSNEITLGNSSVTKFRIPGTGFISDTSKTYSAKELDLRDVSTQFTGTDTGSVGQKINLWGGIYGIGIENASLVNYVPYAASFVIKNTYGGQSVFSVSHSGSTTISSDLTVSGNLTVNGTTTNLNSTNLVIEDKNIIIADVATPTDTTADGAGITIKGATDKTLTWVNSTKSFTTSDPLIIDGTNSTTVPLLVKVPTAQTTNSFEVQDSRGYSMFKVIAPAGGTAYNNGAIWIRPWGTGNVAAMGTDSYQGFYFVSPATSTINFGTGGGGKSFEIVVNDTFNRYKVEGKGTGVAPIFTTNGNDTDVNMHIYPKGAGKIGINTTTPTGYVHAVSSSSSTVGLIVEGATGQTSTNIFEVQRAGGSDPSFAVSHNYINLNRNTTAAASLSVYGSNSGAVPLYVVGRASQSVNLQEWQNNSGQVRASIGSNGNLSLNYATGIKLYNTANTDYASLWMDNGSGGTNLYVKTNYPVLMGDVGVDTGASLTVATQSVSQVGQVIRGISSQSADLQQWQRSNGNPDLRVTNFGTLISGGGTTIASNPTINAYGAAMVISSGVNTYPMLILKAAASQSANIQEWQNSAGTVIAKVMSTGGFVSYANSLFTAGLLVTGNYGGTSTFRIENNQDIIGAVVKANSSQTASLQEWQASDATVLARIDSNGSFITKNGLATGSLSFSGITYNGLSNPTGITSVPTLVVKAIGSQSANIQEWHNSAGTTIGLISVGGDLIIPGSRVAIGQASVASATMFISTAAGASFTPIVSRAAASQTADLQQWQDSVGNVLSRISPNGLVNTSAILSKNNYSSYFSFADNQPIFANPLTAAHVALVVKGTTSQTANLQEWQNSAGTVLAKIGTTGKLTITNTSAADSLIEANGSGGGQFVVTAYGGIITNGGLSSIGASSYFGGYGGTSNVVVNVTGASGQTGDLQRWTNFVGTTLAKVDSLGNFTATSKSFDIAHPTKENMRLRYGSLEGPENGVYVRGTTESSIIELPDYWTGLVHEDSITASLTSVGSAQNIYVEKIENNKIYIGGNLEKAFFTVYGERKDIDKLTVEY